MTKLKNSKCDKTQIVTKIILKKNLKGDKTQIVTKLKHSNLDKTKKKTQIVTNSKILIMTNLNYEKSQFMREKKIKEGF